MRKMIIQELFKVRATMNQDMSIQGETCLQQSILLALIQTSKNPCLLQAILFLISLQGKIIIKPVRQQATYKMILKRAY